MGHRPSGCPKYQEVVNFGFGSNSADRVAAEMTGLHPEADVLARALAVALAAAWNVRFCMRPCENARFHLAVWRPT